MKSKKKSSEQLVREILKKAKTCEWTRILYAIKAA